MKVDIHYFRMRVAKENTIVRCFPDFSQDFGFRTRVSRLRFSALTLI